MRPVPKVKYRKSPREGGGGVGRGGLPYKKDDLLAVPFRVKKSGLVPDWVMSPTRSSAEAFAGPFKVQSRKKNMTEDKKN